MTYVPMRGNDTGDRFWTIDCDYGDYVISQRDDLSWRLEFFPPSDATDPTAIVLSFHKTFDAARKELESRF